MSTEKTVLITGATGFIGSNLSKLLVSLDFDVHIIVRRSSNLEILDQLIPNITVHHHNGSTAGMRSIIKKVQPDCVFHLASLFLVKHSSKDVIPLVKSNILFGTQLLDAMAEFNVLRLINASTSWVHFGQAIYDPVCLYAATKMAFEDILVYYNNGKMISSISLELFDTYGPNDPRHKLFYALKNASQSTIPVKMSPGDQLIDLVYIDDVMDAFLTASKLISKVKSNPKYMVTSGNLVTLKEIVNLYEEINNHRINVEWGGLPYREREVMIPWQIGETLPDWSPKIDLRKGISMIS